MTEKSTDSGSDWLTNYPPENASTRWYTSRALFIFGVGMLFITAFADPLSGSTDSLAGPAAILLGAGIEQTRTE